MCFVTYETPSLVLLRQAKMMWFSTQQHPNIWTLIKFQVNNRATSFCVNPKIKKSPDEWLLCQPDGPRDQQAGDCCLNPKDQEITRRVIVVCTLRTNIPPGGWLLCEHKGPGDNQVGDCSVNPKDQEIIRRVIVVCEPKGPGDHQAGKCCVNPKDQEIIRWVSVVWTQRTRRSSGG